MRSTMRIGSDRSSAPHVRGRVLEVGAGHGTFSGLLADRADELVITDPSDRAVGILASDTAAATTCWSSPRISNRPLPVDRSTRIVMINVLEHIQDDEKALIKLREALAPGGNLCLVRACVRAALQ